MIIDSHVHVLPDRVRENLPAIRDADAWFAACHPEGAATASIEALIESMDREGVEKSVCFTWPFADMTLCREANDYLAAAIGRHPGRLIGFGIVNPAAPGAAGEVERCASLGLKGIGEINADAQGWSFDGEAIAQTMKAVAACGLAVNLHTSEALGHDFPGRGTAWPGRLLEWVKRFPEVRTIAAHMGGGLPFFTALPGVEMACRPSALRSAFDHVPQSRLLYGSDFPLLSLPRYQAQFQSAGLTQSELAALTGGNAEALFGSS
jgi:predicted TIM-barrel fold metal-dependent hydrolase